MIQTFVCLFNRRFNSSTLFLVCGLAVFPNCILFLYVTLSDDVVFLSHIGCPVLASNSCRGQKGNKREESLEFALKLLCSIDY